MKKSILALVIASTVAPAVMASPVNLKGDDLAAAQAYISKFPTMPDYLKENILIKNNLQEANWLLDHNSFYDSATGKNVMLPQINKGDVDMNKTVIATVVAAASIAAPVAHASHMTSEQDQLVAEYLSLSTTPTTYVNQGAATATAKNPDEVMKTLNKQWGNKAGFDYVADFAKFVAAKNAPKTPAPVLTETVTVGGKAYAPVAVPAGLANAPAIQDLSSTTTVSAQPTGFIAPPMANTTPATPAAVAPVATATPATPAKPSAPAPLFTVLSPAPVAPLAPTKVALKPAATVAPAYQNVAIKAPLAKQVSTIGFGVGVAVSDSLPLAGAKTSTVVDTTAQDLAKSHLIALKAADFATKNVAPNYGSQDVQAHNDAVDHKQFDDKFASVAVGYSRKGKMQAQQTLADIDQGNKISASLAQRNDTSGALKSAQAVNHAYDVAQQHKVLADYDLRHANNLGAGKGNSPASATSAPVITKGQGKAIQIVNPVPTIYSSADLSGSIINPQSPNATTTTTVANPAPVIAPPIYVAPQPTPVAKTPVAVTPATPKAPVVAPAPIVAPSAPVQPKAPVDLSQATLIVDHVPGKLNVKVDTLPQVHGFASTSTDIVDTQKVAPVVVPVQDSMNIAHNNPTGAPTPVKTPVAQPAPAPLTITTTAKQYAPVSGAAPSVPQPVKTHAVVIQTVQDPDQTVTIVKTDPVVKTSVAKAQISAKPAVVALPHNAPTPAPTATQVVAQANTVNTQAPVIVPTATTTTQAQPTAQPAAKPVVAQPTAKTPVAIPASKPTTPAPVATPKPAQQTAQKAPVKPLGTTQGVATKTPVKPAQGAYAQNQAAQAQAVTNANAQASAHTYAAQTAGISQAQFDAQQDSNNERFNSIDKRIKADRKHASQGIANVAAMSNIPQVLENQDWSVGAGVGAFDGETGVAVGFSARINDHTTVKASVGAGSTGGATVGAGVSIGY